MATSSNFHAGRGPKHILYLNICDPNMCSIATPALGRDGMKTRTRIAQNRQQTENQEIKSNSGDFRVEEQDEAGKKELVMKTRETLH